MDVEDVIRNRIEVREYAEQAIDPATREAILDAARLAPSGRNHQHWRFIVVDDQEDLTRLAEISTTGSWIEDAAFAVVVLTDPEYYYHQLDAGRAITNMQFLGWNRGVGSCIYTGYDDELMREHLEVPDEYAIPAVVGFGRPPFDIDQIQGRKNRRSLSDLVYQDRYGRSASFGER